MAELPITGFDMAVVGVLLISAIIAFARGFVRELLSIAGFILAALAALWSYPALREPVEAAVNPDWLAHGLVVIAVFMAVYIGVTVVTHSISNIIHSSERIGFFDRTLGFVFGVVRGLILAALALIIYEAVAGDQEQPEWLANAVTYDIVAETARTLRVLAPEGARFGSTLIPLGEE